MQNAGHFGPGAASAQPPTQFVPSEPSVGTIFEFDTIHVVSDCEAGYYRHRPKEKKNIDLSIGLFVVMVCEFVKENYESVIFFARKVF